MVQLVHVELPYPLYVPLGQVEQFTDNAGEYRPLSHEVQAVAPLVDPVENPWEQSIQKSVCAVGAYLPLSQYSQLDLLKAYCPGTHASHVTRSAVLNFPLEQS